MGAATSKSGVDRRPPASVAEKLAFVFAWKHRPDDDPRSDPNRDVDVPPRKPYTQRELAAYVKQRTGKGTESYISKLCKGHQVGISLPILQAIASFFGVTLDVFSDDYIWSDDAVRQQLNASTDRVRQQLDLSAALDRHREDGLRIEAARAIVEMDDHELSVFLPQLTYIVETRKDLAALRKAGEVTVFGAGENDQIMYLGADAAPERPRQPSPPTTPQFKPPVADEDD
jgi:transcriptional regulator with XRE-family HTH domain